MESMAGLNGLETLHRDLLALEENRLLHIDRLCAQLEHTIDSFRNLLQKSPRNERSRKSLTTGKLQISDEEYAVNEEFQQGALQLADTLDLDEIEAGRIFFESQLDAETLGRSILEGSIIRFHQTRKYLLDCFRLVFQLAVDANIEDHIREILQEVVRLVLQTEDNIENGPKYVRKCCHSMGDIKSWLQSLTERLNSASVLGQTFSPEFTETMEYQRVSLVQQHESLGVIIHFLVKSNYSSSAEFEYLLDVLKGVDKNDNLLVHYFPAISAFISIYGAQEGTGTLREARQLNQKILGYRDHDPWALHYVYAAVCAWWLTEYSGWYLDNPVGSPLVNVNLDDESKLRTKQFADSLKDGAFDFLLSISADVKSLEWFDPSRRNLREWLQLKAPPLLPDSIPFSGYFQSILMEQLEIFIDSFITHMPDVLRKLRVDEDEQRQLSQTHEHDLDLERFLIIIAFAFEGRPDAAQAFWSDPDSNLAGFLSWASRRASTPLVSAFCEMLQAISEDEECATAAHHFLLDEGPASSGKMKRSHSLTWNQIFKELTFFSSRIRDRPALPQSSLHRGARQNDEQAELEPEEDLMLQSYLRLISRLCTESGTVRKFILLDQPTVNIIELLYQLASIPNSISFPSRRFTRLRACAFNTLRSLLSHKTKDVGTFIWNALDSWMLGGYMAISNMPKTAGSTTLSPMSEILVDIRTGIEEPIAFIQLLQALILPYEADAEVSDSLPFPELLGSSNRMPGIDPYVDFVGEVFGTKINNINDPLHAKLLSLTCLDFIVTCLSTFNEDLVIFASQSNVSVDSAIGATDLETYMQLHPFSKIMPWMFNDRVTAALFATIHEDAAEVGNASPGSPLVLSILRAIHVISLVMELQTTYVNIVKPKIKSKPAHRHEPIDNTTFASFEDSILSHLFVIVDLGLYCGVGHSELTIAALKLLGKLSTSSKLVNPPSTGVGRFHDRNKAIAALESNDDSDRIARSLINELNSTLELEDGPECDGYIIKVNILDFLNASLDSSPLRPTIAHLLLGFQCGSDTVDIKNDSPFSSGSSLFHTILGLAIEYPIRDDRDGILSWAISLRYKALQVLKTLWRSPLTTTITMGELRKNDFMINILARDVTANTTTLWDGRRIEDDEFITSTSSTSLLEFVRFRAASLQYASSELRQIAREHVPSVKERLLIALQGYCTSNDGRQIRNPTIFDLFDFMELEVPIVNPPVSPSHFKEVDLSVCLESPGDAPPTYNLRGVQELTALRRSELYINGQLNTPQDELNFNNEAQTLILSLRIYNQQSWLKASRLTGLEAWVQVVAMMGEAGGSEGRKTTSFLLQALQVIIPKLERYSLDRLDESLSLAKLAKLLIFNIDFNAQLFEKGGDMGDLANDKLLQLFRVCLRAIHVPSAAPSLKEALYCICYRYLSGMSEIAKDSAPLKRHSTYTIKSMGERLMGVICDDAFAGGQTCRISALLLLNTFVTLARQEASPYITDSLVRLNFISLVVDSIRTIVTELRESVPEDLELQITFFNAKLALLLNIARTRPGAAAVFDAGVFQAVKASGLFLTDPDLGVDIDDSYAVKKQYRLLSAVMRVLNATVFSRGFENELTMRYGQKFLSDNRLSILTVLKRSARIGIPDQGVSEDSVEELAGAYMLLISLTGYLDVNESGEDSRSTEVSASIFI